MSDTTSEKVREIKHEINNALTILIGKLDILAKEHPEIKSNPHFERLHLAHNRIQKAVTDLGAIQQDIEKMKQ